MTHRILGAIFISLSGIFFTAERIAERLSVAVRDAGFASAGMSTPGMMHYPGFFNNFFVWFFFLIGLILIAIGVFKRE
ncbi:hypothetical protein [Neobacillus sp. YIM B06451]|uniref:hypothetical protein n=1 Tax=Neobacillus sp. YIM B06451 TaxID=3070994 RepID=UPI002931B8BE|nr:hypothetical protein [Neobacillus sp. YIM B06451]